MIILKIGGGKGINVEGIVKDLKDVQEEVVIVHGANAARDQLLKDLGKEKKVLTSVKGYSSVYSDDDLIDSMMMVYAGLRNKRIVELCQSNGINALGLSGLDGRIIQGRRNTGIRVKDGEKIKIVRDNSGKPKEVNVKLLRNLLDQGVVPVLTQPIADEKGFAINSENDDMVRVLAENLKADTIINFIEAPGFLDDAKDESSMVKNISQEELKEREEQVEGRMKRKMLSLRKLFEGGAAKVIITDGRRENPLKNAENGTVIQ